MLLLKTQAASFPNTISSRFTWCTHICICRCVHVSTDIHKFMLSTKGQCGYGQQKLVPLELPLLFVNDTNRSFVSTPSLSYITPLPLSFLHFLSLLVKDFFFSLCLLLSLSLSFLCLSTVLHPSILQSLLPFSSPRQMVIVSLGWLRNQRCNSLFFFLHRSFSAPLFLPSLILVSSHCGAFNASYHMVAESNWRCGGAFIGASKHSCNNACQGSRFFITLMLYRVNPTNYPPPLEFTQLFFPFLLMLNRKLVGILYWKEAIINHTMAVTWCAGEMRATRFLKDMNASQPST